MSTATKTAEQPLELTAASAAPDGVMQTCPLCQSLIDPDCASCSPACPMAKGCSVLTCPKCGYSFPRPTGVSAWLQRFFAARRARAEAAAPHADSLAQVGAGRRVRVTGFVREEGPRLSRLAAFGIVEGSELCVQQRYPALVVQVGETTLGLDIDVARAVLVEPLSAPEPVPAVQLSPARST